MGGVRVITRTPILRIWGKSIILAFTSLRGKALGGLLGSLGGFLGASWAVLGHLEAILGRLGTILGHLGDILGHLGDTLGHLGPASGKYASFLKLIKRGGVRPGEVP